MNGIEPIYGFPLFTKGKSVGYIVKHNRLRVSDIWAFWDYIIKMQSKKQKASEVTFLKVLLGQASYFYEAAERAPIYSQPLLYYYSFLNLAKIIVNIYNWYGISSEYYHGIETKVDATTRLDTSEVRIKEYSPPNKISIAKEFMNNMGDTRVMTGAVVKIIDCLKFCVGIHRTYCESFNKDEIFFRIGSPKLIRKGKQLYYRGEIIGCNDKAMHTLRYCGYNISQDKKQYYWEENESMPNYNISRSALFNLSQTIKQKWIWSYTDGCDYRQFISTDKSLNMGSVSVIYITMFFLGSITRYHPYLFDSLLTEKEKWLVSEFLKTQPKQFLYHVTSQVTGITLLKGRTSNL